MPETTLCTEGPLTSNVDAEEMEVFRPAEAPVAAKVVACKEPRLEDRVTLLNWHPEPFDTVPSA